MMRWRRPRARRRRRTEGEGERRAAVGEERTGTGGQESPNENGPLWQKLMMRGSEKQDFHSTL